jgi:hypothetical protein
MTGFRIGSFDAEPGGEIRLLRSHSVPLAHSLVVAPPSGRVNPRSAGLRASRALGCGDERRPVQAPDASYTAALEHSTTWRSRS